MCGIFGYYQFKVSRTRQEILEHLFTGLRRLEYRGYDSAGVSIDADPAELDWENGHSNGNGAVHDDQNGGLPAACEGCEGCKDPSDHKAGP